MTEWIVSSCHQVVFFLVHVERLRRGKNFEQINCKPSFSSLTTKIICTIYTLVSVEKNLTIIGKNIINSTIRVY